MKLPAFKKDSGSVKALEAVKTPVRPSAGKKIYNKKELIIGVIFIFSAFVCIFFIVYMMVRSHRQAEEDYQQLNEAMLAINAQSEAAQQEAEGLQQRLGTSLSLQKVLDEAQKEYGPKEKSRREGSLWIDRRNKACFVTLGALHGLTPGAKLLVFDGEQEIGAVRVETPMDVISYVRPINQDFSEFPKDYYRVSFPKNNY